MKIRKKLVVVVVVTFILNTTTLFAYYKYNMSDRISSLIRSIEVELDSKVEQIYKNILKDHTIDNIDKILINNKENKYYLSVKDINGNQIYEFGEKMKGTLKLTSIKLVEINNKACVIELIKMLPIDDIKNIPLIDELIKVEIIVLGTILILLTFIIYLNFVKPIQYLQKDINNYKYGIKPTFTKRSDEIGWLKNKFVMLTEDLDDEKDKQNKIIASISHDIKTPLTSIMGYAERLQNSNLNEERRKRYTEVIYSKSQHINELIDEFDEYLSYNLESSIKKECISIEDLISIIKKEFEDELNQLDVDLKIISDCERENINIDVSKIRRVIGNIVGNSLKHMNKAPKMIDIRIIKKIDKIQISIADNGCGVDEKEINKIFEALYTSDNSRKVAGLGLSICKKAIEGHKGQIWAENNEYGGLTVSFTI